MTNVPPPPPPYRYRRIGEPRRPARGGSPAAIRPRPAPFDVRHHRPLADPVAWMLATLDRSAARM